MSGGTVIEFDQGQLSKILARLSAKQLEAALDNAATDLAHKGEEVAKDTTPQVTGNARRSTVSDVTGRDKLVMGRYPYLNWLDTGKDSRGRMMQTRPGGYLIRRTTRAEVVRLAQKAMERAAGEIADGWGGR